jgi:hypothetical protein
MAKKRRRKAIRIVSPQSREGREKLTTLLKSFERRFAQGDDVALLLGAELCLFFEIKAPPWVRENFSTRFWAWYRYHAASLDEAFKVTRERKHIDRQRLRQEVRGFVVYAVAHEVRRNPNRARKKIYAEVGKAFGLSGFWIETLFYERASRPWRKLFRIDTPA